MNQYKGRAMAYWITEDEWIGAFVTDVPYPDDFPNMVIILVADQYGGSYSLRVPYNGVFASGTTTVCTDLPIDITKLTDNSGGITDDGYVSAVDFPLLNANTINDNMAELTAKINQIIDYLKL